MKPYYETKLGKLYLGDCFEILPELSIKPDLVLTDPPYLMIMGGGGCFKNREYVSEIKDFINKGIDYSFLNNFDNWFCFCSKEQLVELISKASNDNWMLLTWNKSNPTPFCNNTYLPDTEYIVHKWTKGCLYGNYKDKTRYIYTNVRKSEFDHPTVKPLLIIDKLLKLGSKKNDLVLDAFLGSGTTAVACEDLKRRWVGIEKEEKYCEIAAKRIDAIIKQGRFW